VGIEGDRDMTSGKHVRMECMFKKLKEKMSAVGKILKLPKWTGGIHTARTQGCSQDVGNSFSSKDMRLLSLKTMNAVLLSFPDDDERSSILVLNVCCLMLSVHIDSFSDVCKLGEMRD
jgi:hypothetical protein